MSGLTLSYWSGRGLMEVPRMMLAIKGHFPGAGYIDDRRTGPPDNCDANLGRMPIATTTDGVAIGQSSAINFLVASECGLMGSTPVEAAQVLAFQEHLRELMTQFRSLVPYGAEPTAAALDTFFNESEAVDFSGPADGAKRSARNLVWYAGRLEKLVGDGFAVGGKLSLADVLLYNHFADSLTPEQCTACIASVAAHPNVKKWMAERGPQGF